MNNTAIAVKAELNSMLRLERIDREQHSKALAILPEILKDADVHGMSTMSIVECIMFELEDAA